MRRHRHINPAKAGADMVFDSRYNFTLANGDPVDTWASRRPATVDAAGVTTTRPLYTTNVQGGQPGILFDATDDMLNTGVTRNDSELTVIYGVLKGAATGNRSAWGNRVAATGRIMRTTATALVYAQIGGTTFTYTYTLSAATVATVRVSSGENAVVQWANGVASSSTAYGTYVSSAGTFRLGAAGAAAAEYWTGYLLFVYVWPSAISASLRRRFEQASAYSIKTPYL